MDLRTQAHLRLSYVHSLSTSYILTLLTHVCLTYACAPTSCARVKRMSYVRLVYALRTCAHPYPCWGSHALKIICAHVSLHENERTCVHACALTFVCFPHVYTRKHTNVVTQFWAYRTILGGGMCDWVFFLEIRPLYIRPSIYYFGDFPNFDFGYVTIHLLSI